MQKFSKNFCVRCKFFRGFSEMQKSIFSLLMQKAKTQKLIVENLLNTGCKFFIIDDFGMNFMIGFEQDLC